jgi:hypothetical protein
MRNKLQKILIKARFYGQTFGFSPDDEFSVPELFDWAKNNVPLTNIPTKALEENIEHSESDEAWGSEEFHERAMQADLSYPILVFEDENGFLWIADGMHRLYKAMHEGRDTLQGYIVNENQLEQSGSRVALLIVPRVA